MAPHSTHSFPVSSLKIRVSTNRSPLQTGEHWLRDKHETDGAEGLWRVHDGIYDLTDFADKHPGGKEWISLTKGTDITEAFEVHHLSTRPDELLRKHYVRPAKTRRNAPFTFKEDGFYRTLKSEVRQVLRTLPKQSVRTSAFFTDSLLAGLFLFAILANSYWSYKLAAIAGIFLGCVTIAAHNYFHKKDNFRMYYFNFSLMSFREWRISHVLSHHLHTNTLDDLEITFLEPILQFLPVQKDWMYCVTSWLAFPILCVVSFHVQFTKFLVYVIKKDVKPQPHNALPLLLPWAMFVFGSQSLMSTLLMWNFIVMVGSAHFFVVGFNAAHHHPDIFHDGDAPRSVTDYDWGLSQLDAIMDRTDITGSHFLVLTNFGDHGLHHLFPTLDHGTLEHLYPVHRSQMYKVANKRIANKPFFLLLLLLLSLLFMNRILITVDRHVSKYNVNSINNNII